MSIFAPLGPGVPKPPRPKGQKFVGDVYGWINADATFTTGTEIYAYVEASEDFILCESCTVTDLQGNDLVIVDGIIS